MHLIQVHEQGRVTSFTGKYRPDLQTDKFHKYETNRGEILEFDKASITYVTEPISVIPPETAVFSEHILIDPINEEDDSLIFDGVKHPTMTADNWGYFITTDHELIHVNRRHFKC